MNINIVRFLRERIAHICRGFIRGRKNSSSDARITQGSPRRLNGSGRKSSEHRYELLYKAGEADQLPRIVIECILSQYGEEGLDFRCFWWYSGQAKYFLSRGIPEEGVVGLLGMDPKGRGEHVLKKRPFPRIFDTLAIPRRRVTSKAIATFRRDLESELRSICSEYPQMSKYLNEWVKEYCIDSPDEDIADMKQKDCSPCHYAEYIVDYL